jgi:ATP-dependent RNA helicase DDX24/MAK5
LSVSQVVKGSGKTLAYGIPIVQHLINQLQTDPDQVKRPSALILAPTRELAMQVKEHLAKLVLHCLVEDDHKKPPPIRVVVLTGGMSIQKQRRQLQSGAEIIVATPGRLWDLVSELPELSRNLSQLDFLVLDEADRMMEGGHYAELDNIFKLTNRCVVSSAAFCRLKYSTEPKSPLKTTLNRKEWQPSSMKLAQTCATTFSLLPCLENYSVISRSLSRSAVG